jgi:GxxExxY protein
MVFRQPVQRPEFAGKYSDLTKQILRAFFDLHTELGYGFSEKVYENSLLILLRERGMIVQQQMPIQVHFHNQVVGEYFADLLVNEVVLLELKAVSKINEDHAAQLLNYLKATDIEVGLVLNFGQTAEFRRRVYDNARKGSKSWMKA